MASPLPDEPMLPALRELSRLEQWVCWRYETRSGEAKPTKVPYVAGTTNRASSTNPATWRPYALALASVGVDGIGFVVTKGDPYVAGDLDHCRDAETGAIEDWAAAVIRDLYSYTEVTPIRTGLRVFCRGSLPKGGRNKRLDKEGRGIEFYEHSKFLTVTGEHLAGTPVAIRGRTEQLAAVHARYFGGKPPDVGAVPVAPKLRLVTNREPLDDDSLIKRACAAANGDRFSRLWGGDTSMHAGDDSAADMALVDHLAYWTDGDAGRVDRLFRRSGLMRPEKWDRRAGAGGQTYGEITIAKAVERHGTARKIEREGGPVATVQAVTAAGRVRSLSELLSGEVEEPRHVVPGIIQRGLMILAGKPKIGKSFLVLNVALAVASGGVALGRIPCPAGDVLYLALEDSKARLHRRAKKLLAGAAVPSRFDYALEWSRLDLGGLAELETWLDAHPDAALVVIDVWKRIKPPPPKGSNAYDADYDAIVQLQRLAVQRGVAIVVVHHLNKNPSEDDTDVISGSIGFTGGADGHIVMKLAGKGNAIFRGRARDVEEPFDYALAWDSVLGSWSIVGDADKVLMSAERRQILAVLERTGRPMKPHEVAPLVNKTAGATKYLMWSMATDGQLEHRDGGYYFCPNRPIEPDAATPPNSTNRPNREGSEGAETPQTVRDAAIALTGPNRPEGLLQGLAGDPVRAVSGVGGNGVAGVGDALRSLHCRKCDGWLTQQEQASGLCRKCSHWAEVGDDPI